MYRKLLLSAVLAASTIAGISITPSDAGAYPVPSHDRRDHLRFEVIYYHRNHWDCFGTYGSFRDAQRAANRLRHQGYDVRVEREFVR